MQPKSADVDRNAPGEWTRKEWLRALNEALGDGALDEDELASAWNEALDHEGTPVPIGHSGRRVEVFPGAGIRLPRC